MADDTGRTAIVIVTGSASAGLVALEMSHTDTNVRMANEGDMALLRLANLMSDFYDIGFEYTRPMDIPLISYDEGDFLRFLDPFLQPLREIEIRVLEKYDIPDIRLEDLNRPERPVDRAVRFDLQATRDWQNRDYRRPKRRRK